MLNFSHAGRRKARGVITALPLARQRAVARSLGAAALLMGLVAPLPTFADGGQVPDGAYRLKPGDRIAVTVFGQPELSGEILIADANTIDLPFIGPISVKNMTIPDCQRAIVSRLADGVLVKPAVSVRIAELRPIYVLGDVRTPGAYPFRYGSTVKSALAAAGGFGPTPVEQGSAVSDFLLADERLRELAHEQIALLVRRARLEAQRDGVSKFQPPSRPGSADTSDFAEVVAIETVTFDSQATVLKNQLDLVRSQKPRLENEINAVRSQIAIEKQQVDVIRQQSDQYSSLLKQGLGLAAADMQLKLDQATRQSDILRLEAEVSRLQMDEGELDIKLEEVESTFRKQVISDLRDVQERLAEVRISLDSARDIREARLRQAGSVAGSQIDHTITVTRYDDDKATALPGADGLALQPGDVVEIAKVLPRSASPSGATIPQADLAPSQSDAAKPDVDSATAAR